MADHMPNQRTIAVVTGSRAEFGLLASTMHAVRDDRRLRLLTIVAGSHLVAGTWQDVRDAGFDIDAKVRMQRRAAAGRHEDVQSLARGVAAFGKVFQQTRPDVVVVLGDRVEVFAAASAAALGGIHVAHIHGGDRAEGVHDESIRHALSKLAHIHLAATAASRRRLIRMGERDDLVFDVGSPAVDGLADVQPIDDAPDLLVLQHPIGAADAQERDWMLATLAATADHPRMVLLPNADPGRDGVLAAIETLREPVVEHLPRPAFLRILAAAHAIVGNSSAALIEAAVLRVPAVNVGPRQGGRQRPSNVVDCDYGEQSVRNALAKARRKQRGRIRHPYGPGGAGVAIAELLATIDLADVPLRKQNSY